jgi:cell division topological specificity factor
VRSLLDIFRLRARQPSSADTARDRLQLLLAVERVQTSGQDFLPMMQKELIDVIRKYIPIEDERVRVKVDKVHGISVLELNVELPPGGSMPRAGAA